MDGARDLRHRKIRPAGRVVRRGGLDSVGLPTQQVRRGPATALAVHRRWPLRGRQFGVGRRRAVPPEHDRARRQAEQEVQERTGRRALQGDLGRRGLQPQLFLRLLRGHRRQGAFGSDDGARRHAAQRHPDRQSALPRPGHRGQLFRGILHAVRLPAGDDLYDRHSRRLGSGRLRAARPGPEPFRYGQPVGRHARGGPTDLDPPTEQSSHLLSLRPVLLAALS